MKEREKEKRKKERKRRNSMRDKKAKTKMESEVKKTTLFQLFCILYIRLNSHMFFDEGLVFFKLS